MNWQLCCDTIQSLCRYINVTLPWIVSLAVILYNHCVVILMLLWPWIGSFVVILKNYCAVILMLLWHLNWQLCCDTIQSLCGDINPTLPWICSLAVISCNHCVVILMLLWPWIGSFAVILYNHCVVILKLLCRELAAFLWYYTIIVWWY